MEFSNVRRSHRYADPNLKTPILRIYVTLVTSITDTILINFGRPPVNQCLPLSNRRDPAVAGQPFAARKIKSTNKFTAQIGPTGGSKGYVKITGRYKAIRFPSLRCGSTFLCFFSTPTS